MPYQPIIEHYDDGAPIQQSDGGQTANPKAQAYKDASRDYKRMLRAEYYDEDTGLCRQCPAASSGAARVVGVALGMGCVLGGI